jgi:hypothetical protein
VRSNIAYEDRLILGRVRSSYLDSHGYESAEVSRIAMAMDATSIEEFISRTEGCGMSIVELEWFWGLEHE